MFMYVLERCVGGDLLKKKEMSTKPARETQDAQTQDIKFEQESPEEPLHTYQQGHV